MKKILIISILTFMAVSCEDEVYSTIPNSPVSLTIDLSFRDKVLNGTLSWKKFTEPRDNTDRLGFGGLLIINGIGENIVNIYAYDLACPVEADRNVKIEPDSSGMKAICPKCKAVYLIHSGTGTPESGSKYYLKQYRVITGTGNTYQIRN